MTEPARKTSPFLGAGIAALAFAALVAALAVVGVGAAGGSEWFGPPGTLDRQAAQGTSSRGQYADIGNGIAGTCVTRFEYQEIRLRIDVTSDSRDRVVAFFGNAGGFASVLPGASHTWTLDKGANHCRFEGPTGELEGLEGVVRVETKEGYTPSYSSSTPIDVVVDGGSRISLAEGGSRSLGGGIVISRPADPRANVTAEIVLTVRNV